MGGRDVNCHFLLLEQKIGLLYIYWLNLVVFTQVSSVPHPYGSHVQFERSMRNPVGKHWNTGTTVNQLTKPRVETLIGTIIEPIKATKEIKRRKPDDRKNNKKGKESSGIKIHS